MNDRRFRYCLRLDTTAMPELLQSSDGTRAYIARDEIHQYQAELRSGDQVSSPTPLVDDAD
jgi:hypothetical protein